MLLFGFVCSERSCAALWAVTMLLGVMCCLFVHENFVMLH
jgi:hypothetical protein